jgi:serine protease Do
MNQIKKTLIIGFLSGIVGGGLVYIILPEKTKIYYETPLNSVYKQTSFIQQTATVVDFVKASALSTPSVVYIKTHREGTQTFSSWFDYFFDGRSSHEINTGSGVIFTPDGYIVTNNHVIEKASYIEVVHMKRSYTAKVVGKDPSTDIAVIKIDAQQKLPAIELGSSSQLKVGEWVLAVGNPFNLTSTVTAGIVSAKGRDIKVVKSNFPLESFIQTDAAINPGNSGGALVNKDGKLVGINTAILSQTGTYTGYGFAVPIDIVTKIVKDIIEYGSVQKAFTGMEVSDMNADIGNKFNMLDLSGVVVSFLSPDGAAAKAGIKKGDIILSIDDTLIEYRSEFEEQISYRRPGDKIKLKVKRDDKEFFIFLTLTNEEGGTGILTREIYFSNLLNAELEKVSKVERDKLKIEQGVKIISLKPNSFLRRLSMDENYIIVSVNNKKINQPVELEEELKKSKGRVIIEAINNNGAKGFYQFFF